MIILRQKKYNKRKSTVYLLVGIPGSGKSTWCKKNYPNLPIISRDLIRAELGYTSSPNEKAILKNWQEDKVSKKENEYISMYLKSGKDFIIDDTNLRLIYRKPLIHKLRKNGAYVIGVNFNTPIDVCIKRRKSQINPEIMKVIKSTMDKLEKSEVDELINVK